MDKHLASREYFADRYSIADMAIYPWLTYYDRQGQNLDDFPHLKRWYVQIGGRTPVQYGMALLPVQHRPGMSEHQKEILFGKAQYHRR